MYSNVSEKDAVNQLLQYAHNEKTEYRSSTKQTGEEFNIFRILGMERREVRTHSAFLRELLDPQGSHGCKELFLRLFIEVQRLRWKDKPQFLARFASFDPCGSQAFAEEHLGFIDEAGTSGGRVDIIIRDKKGKVIIIENKIDAGDGDFQLLRYNNAYKEAPIFYLTIWGSQPNHSSSMGLHEGNEFVCISYKDDIIRWLKKCSLGIENMTPLNFSVNQYIQIVEHITKQSNLHKMNDRITNKIKESSEMYEAAQLIRSRINEFESSIKAAAHGEINKLSNELAYNKHIPLIRFRNYVIKSRLSDEANFWHYDLVPYRIDGSEERFGCANDKEIQEFRLIVKNFPGEKFQNVNYLIWIFFDKNLAKLSIKDYVALEDEKIRQNWASEVIDGYRKNVNMFIDAVKTSTFAKEIEIVTGKL